MSASPLFNITGRPILLDGALGTELMKVLPAPGLCPELANLEHPEAVRSVHRAYFEAGADAVTSNSLGANPLKLAAAGLSGRARSWPRPLSRILLRGHPSAPREIHLRRHPVRRKIPQAPGTGHRNADPDGFAVQTEWLAEGGADFLLIETMLPTTYARPCARSAEPRRGAPGFRSWRR